MPYFTFCLVIPFMRSNSIAAVGKPIYPKPMQIVLFIVSVYSLSITDANTSFILVCLFSGGCLFLQSILPQIAKIPLFL